MLDVMMSLNLSFKFSICDAIEVLALYKPQCLWLLG